MPTVKTCGLLAVATLAIAACGSNNEQRTATGALTGAGIGALAGGPIGAAIGLGVGGAAGTVTPVGADQAAEYGRDELKQTAQSTPVVRDMAREGSGSTGAQRRTTGSGSSEPQAATLRVSPDAVRQIQSSLQAEGLYSGPVDGIVGPQTERALAAYQQRQGLPQTAVLDWRTLQHLGSSGGEQGATAPAETPRGADGER